MQGDAAEMIYFDRILSSSERQKVESYLALKYGVTIDQSTFTDYVASDWDGTSGTKIWDTTESVKITSNPAIPALIYITDIFGIGRDDASALNQKIAKSVNSGAIMTVSMDGDDFSKANAVIVNEHTNNLQFMK